MFEEKLHTAAEHISALGYSPVYVALHGSQNYGLAVHTTEYQSDFDFKCIVLPSLWDLVEGKKPASLTIETENGQIDIKDIRVICDALERMNPAYLESFATDYHLFLPGGEPIEEIRTLTPRLMTERAAVFARACEGLFEDKARRMCHDSPAVHEKILRYGYDGKQAHHMYRLLLVLEAFERSGKYVLEAPKQAHAQLMALKLNRIALQEAMERISEWRERIRRVRGRIEEEYGEAKNEAHRAIVQISREMMFAHCKNTDELTLKKR